MKPLVALFFLFTLSVPARGQDFDKGMEAYERGDYATALDDLRPLAEEGRVEAEFQLGVMYFLGVGVPQDVVEAVKWYQKAAEQGHVVAQVMVALQHETMRDHAEAAKWYRKAADQGNADAQYSLGVLYDRGQGVPQDDAEAVRLYHLAAEQGLADAQLNLGVMYSLGQGAAQDDAEALKWFRKAGEQGHAEAQNVLGWIYRKGKGVPYEYAEAAKWYRLAADQGHAEAQFNLGVMYHMGHGVPKDSVEAYKWYELGASHYPPGDARDMAAKLRDSIALAMTADQIAEAQRLAREWTPSKARPKLDAGSE